MTCDFLRSSGWSTPLPPTFFLPPTSGKTRPRTILARGRITSITDLIAQQPKGFLMCVPTAPEPTQAAVTVSARDLLALLRAYGAGDEEAYDAVLSTLDETELRSMLSVAVGVLRQCELRLGTQLEISPDVEG